MTFLNPLLLFGLAAAAIPVILHLLNLRKLRTIDFSTLAFLKELQQSRVRRLKLRQVLLLIVRTLMIAFIVLAFARPALRGSLPAGFGGAAGSSVAIVLDDSYSMMVSDEGGERFARARKAVRDIISMLKEGDAAWLVKLSDLPVVTVDPPTHDLRHLGEMVDRSRASFVRRPMGDGLAAAVRLLEQSKDVNREIYLVGDFQETSLAGGPVREGDGPDAAVDPRLRLFTVGIGSRRVPNAAVDSVAVLSRIFEKDRPVEVTARIRNYGGDALRDAVVSVFAGDTRMAQSNVTVEPGSAAEVTLTFVPRRSGFIDGSVGLEGDELDPDNRRYFSFSVPERIRVLVITGSPDDARFLLPALRAGTSGVEDSALAVTQAAAVELPRANLRDFDVVVLCGIPSFDQADADRIRSFTAAGGGLVIFPGDESDPANYNSRLLEPMNLPEIRGTTGGRDASGEGTGLWFREIDFDHPLFATIFEKAGRTSETRGLSPRISRSFDLRPTPGSRSVITLSNGAGFFLEQAVGSGRAAIFSCAPILGWSDFPMKGLFAPLVYRTVAYLASGSGRPDQFMVGAEAVVTVRSGRAADPGAAYALKLPDGLEEFAAPVPSGAGLVFRFTNLTLPGNYRLNSGALTLALFPANLPAEEADLAIAGADRTAAFLAARGFSPDQVRSLPAGEELPARITAARFGMELWKYCLGLVLILALVEMAVNRHAGGERAADA